MKAINRSNWTLQLNNKFILPGAEFEATEDQISEFTKYVEVIKQPVKATKNVTTSSHS